MGVYIPNMEMPDGCVVCPFFIENRHDRGDDSLCRASGKEAKCGCPLVPAPPHGDLIDRNKLYEKTAEWEAQALHMVEVTMNDEDVTEWRKWSTVLTERSAFKFDIADAPTIIPASFENLPKSKDSQKIEEEWA